MTVPVLRAGERVEVGGGGGRSPCDYVNTRALPLWQLHAIVAAILMNTQHRDFFSYENALSDADDLIMKAYTREVNGTRSDTWRARGEYFQRPKESTR